MANNTDGDSLSGVAIDSEADTVVREDQINIATDQAGEDIKTKSMNTANIEEPTKSTANGFAYYTGI